MSSRRTVDDHQIVWSVGPGQSGEMLHLSEHQQVVDSGRGTRDHVDHTRRHETFGQSGQTLGGEIILERLGCRQRSQMNGSGARRSPMFAHEVALVGGSVTRCTSEQHVETGTVVKCHNEHSMTPIGCSVGQNCRYRCLADTPFAGHHDQTRRGEQVASRR